MITSLISVLLPTMAVTLLPSAPYWLRFQRGSGNIVAINILTMGCTDVETANLLSSAIFFLGEEIFYDLDNPDIFSEIRPVSRLGNDIIFQITPQVEGIYSCGVRRDSENFIRSQKVTIVGNFPPPPYIMYYNVVGYWACSVE